MKEVAQQAVKKPTITFRQALFWDVDTKTIDPEKHARYIIERILDLGNDEEVRWVSGCYPKHLIQDIVKKSRVLQRKSKALWEPVFA